MEDLRNYKNLLKDLLKTERENDKNWSWRIDGITKTEARIGWGYLDYVGEKRKFTMTIDDSDGDIMVIGRMPDGDLMVASWVGNEHWHDARTIEQGIRQVVRGIAVTARNIY